MIDQITGLIHGSIELHLLPLMAAAIGLEVLYSRTQRQSLYAGVDTLNSVAYLALGALVELLPRVGFIFLIVVLHNVSPLRDTVGQQWWAWLLLFVLDDLSYYFMHRASHKVRLFWAGHMNHHSSLKYNFAVALRAGVGERVHKWVFWLWLPLLGFDVVMILTVMGLGLAYQFWLHTETIKKLPAWFEWCFNTPSHHRVHHASNAKYIDRNHGGTLILWDRLFGTFCAEDPAEPCRYGLTSAPQQQKPWLAAFSEYKALYQDVSQTEGLRPKLRLCFGSPSAAT